MNTIPDFIQLFATQTTLLNSTGNDLSPEMKTYYDLRLLDYAQANLVHDQFGQKRPIPKNGGKTIEFRSFSPLAKATTPLTEGVTPSGNQLDVKTITATVSQYGDFIVQSDVLELTAVDNTILEATKLLGRQAGVTLDTVTRNVMVGGTNVMYAPKINASTGAETPVTSRAGLDNTCVLTVNLVEQVVAELRAQNAPTIDGDYIGIIHPYTAYDLMRDPDWRDPHKYADTTNLYEGEIGKIVFERYASGTAEYDNEILAMCEEIQEKLGEVAALNKDAADRRGKKICPTCGKEVDKAFQFCPFCGAECPVEQEEAEEETQEDGAEDSEAAEAQETGTEDAEDAGAETETEDAENENAGEEAEEAEDSSESAEE